MFVVENVSFENVYLFKQKVMYLVPRGNQADFKHTSREIWSNHTDGRSDQIQIEAMPTFLMKCKVFRSNETCLRSSSSSDKIFFACF